MRAIKRIEDHTRLILLKKHIKPNSEVTNITKPKNNQEIIIRIRRLFKQKIQIYK